MDPSILEKVNAIEQNTLKSILLHIHQKLQSINGELDTITQILDGNNGEVSKTDILDCKHQIKKSESILAREISILRDDVYRELDSIKNQTQKLNDDTKWQISRTNNDITHNLSMLRNTFTTTNRSKSNIKFKK